MMRKDNIEEDDIDMSTDEEDSLKENVVKENKREKNVVCSGIYHENRNDSVNSFLTFSTAEIDDFNVGKYFTVHWPKPKAYYWGKLLKVFFADINSDATGVEIQFLKKVQSYIDPSQVKWYWPATEDKGIVDVTLCFAGPCIPTITDSSRKKSAITFVIEAEVMQSFMKFVNMDFYTISHFTVAIFGICYVHIVLIFVITKDDVFDSKDVVLKEVNHLEPFNLIMNDLSETKSC